MGARTRTPVRSGLVLGAVACVGLASLGLGLSRVFPGAEPPAQTSAVTTNGAACPACDIVVITVCSLRRDHVGAYGATPSFTPRMDAFAAESIRLDTAYAASNFTLGSLAALLTGRLPGSTGVTSWQTALPAEFPTLAEVLGVYGYRTGAFTTAGPTGLQAEYGLARGFTTVEVEEPAGDVWRPGQAGEPAARWIDAAPADTPLFALFHARAAHFPFVVSDGAPDPLGVRHLLASASTGPAPRPGQPAPVPTVGLPVDPTQAAVRALGPAGIAAWAEAYAEAVARADADVGVVIDAVERRGRPTLLVVMADHGEALDEHGELLHGDGYFDEVVHIPMLIQIPGHTPSGSAALVSGVDVLPTLLDLVGARAPAGIDGVSIVPALGGSQVRTDVFVEGGVNARRPGVPARGALIAPPWALLVQDNGCGEATEEAPGTCLFNLAEDPGQTRDRVQEVPDVRTELARRWAERQAALAGARRTSAPVDINGELARELRANGYFSAQPASPPAR